MGKRKFIFACGLVKNPEFVEKSEFESRVVWEFFRLACSKSGQEMVGIATNFY